VPHKPKTFKPRWMQTATRQSRTVARKRYDAERGSAAERGYDARWQKFRKWLLRQPEFAVCGDCTLPTKHIDHIDAVEDANDSGFYALHNLQPLCAGCHARKTIRHDGGYGRKSGDAAALEAMRVAARRRAEAIEARGL